MIDAADVTQLPSTTVPVAKRRKVLRLIDALDDLDDVQAVYSTTTSTTRLWARPRRSDRRQSFADRGWRRAGGPARASPGHRSIDEHEDRCYCHLDQVLDPVDALGVRPP